MPRLSEARKGAAKGGGKADAMMPIFTPQSGGPRAEGGWRTPSDRRERGGKGREARRASSPPRKGNRAGQARREAPFR